MSTPDSDRHEFQARLVWTGAAKGNATDYEEYSREFRVDITGKASIRGSAATAYRGDGALHNPEDLLVASLSACHFLSYIALCARAGVNVVTYEDDAVGTMDKVDRVVRFTEATLRPKVTIAAGSDPEKARALHEKAHSICIIANSVNFPVRNEPTITVAGPA